MINCNNAVVRVYPLSDKNKKMIFTKILNIKDKIFNMKYLKDTLPNIKKLESISLEKLLNLQANTYNKCLFLEKNFCWISKNEVGKERYYTKSNITYSLDVYDLLCIYFNCNYNQLYNYLYDMGFNKNEKFAVDINNHISNKERIKSVVESNPNIKKLINNKWDIYIALNDFAVNNRLAFNEYKNCSIFFISTRFLKEKYNLPYSISTINQVINLYALIGLIYKVPKKVIKDSPIYYIYELKNKKDKRATVSFYAIPSITDVLGDVKKNASFLNEANIEYYKITKDSSIALQNIKNVSPVTYNLNTGGGDKTKKAEKVREEKELIENSFLRHLDEHGIVAKEWIKKDVNSEISNTSFDRKWKDLITTVSGKTIKPTKSMKNKYGLITNQEIFIKNKISG